jgi:selenide,water dikinase
MIDLEKRKRIMQRSILLGHCICNPKQDCPCELFKEKNVCLCAGERLEDAMEDVPLTKFVENAGCASKINQNDLKKVLAGLPEISDPRVLVSSNTCDDAGVYQMDGDLALVQTVDVFTPNVDDAYTFGQIAAANSLSDVYAMGGKPLTALSVIGFPIEKLSHKVMSQIIRGGIDKMSEAGVTVIGGHSINDQDIKFGFAVTGTVHPSKMVTNNKARPGDVFILTKPLGVGVISFAKQMDRASESAMASISQSMAALNRVPSELMVEVGASAATDVTGFGLLGHLSEMVSQSGVTVEVYADRVPVFDEALACIRQQLISGAIERNREYASQYVRVAEDVSEEMEYLLYDPQTSGGLLVAVEEEKAASFVALLKEKGVEDAAIVGRVTAKSEGKIMVRTSPEGKEPHIVKSEETAEAGVSAPGASCCGPAAESECCASPPDAGAGSHAECCASPPDVLAEGKATEIKQKFSEFMGVAGSEGAVSLRNKELIAIALSVLAKCGPCIKIHVEKARKLGISQAEIDEAVWMGVAFGGAPVLMFYKTVMGEK